MSQGKGDESSEGAEDASSWLRAVAQVEVVGAGALRGTALVPGTVLADGRLTVQRRLGAGGMGVVYEAFDRERREMVALKTLLRLDAASIYRLKTEFRALAGVAHEHLVRLYELFSHDGHWFFTMELVHGERFDRFVRFALDEARLRAALSQLLEAIAAIHAAGKLHRDLKPSNVLVTPEGRVVVLDFGLAADPEPGGVGQTMTHDSVSGTPGYMAPEQAAGRAASAASDLYALGVMLFEALTGRLPFEGKASEILAAKQREEAPAASSLGNGVPADLAELCAHLLSREEASRPDVPAVRALLGSMPPPMRVVGAEPELLLGRDAELSTLRQAYDATLAGTPVVMFVSGESGMGKSALVGHFLDELRAAGHAAVLAGRCYERESVPFKGFDALADELSRYLRKLPHAEACALMPREVSALARLFPVLGRIEAVAQAPGKEIPDPEELRQRAFTAFGELMARIRDRRPLVMYIDDAQWLDRDAEAFLRTLLVDRQPVPGLAILAHRSEGAEKNATLQAVIAAARSNPMLDVRTLSVEPLAHAAARELAERLLGREGNAALADDAAREAKGSPFFVASLARYAARAVGRASLSQVSLVRALGDHLSMHSAECRRVLQVLALAGSPLPKQVALDAGQARFEDLDALRASHLVRISSGEALETVECYHDRIRETVATAITDEGRAGLYPRLARALEARSDTDLELLARCLEGAGEAHAAADHYERAGDAAARSTAFDHAAELYGRALALGRDGAEAGLVLALSRKRADALANAGSGPEAAAAYSAAAEAAAGPDAIDLRRKAAQQLLECGHLTEGEALLRRVCGEAGFTIAATPQRALWSMILSQSRLRFARLSPALRSAADVPPEIRLRLDCMHAATAGLVSHAPLVAGSAADRWLLDALRAGHPAHVARALSMQLYFYSFAFPADRRRCAALVAAIERALQERVSPEVRAFALMCLAKGDINSGRWTAGRAAEARALALLRGEAVGVSWEIDACLVYDHTAAIFRGDFNDLARAGPPVIESAFRRGRVWVGAVLSGWAGTMACLASADVSDARRQLDDAANRWVPQPEMQWADFYLALGEAVHALYRGEPSAGNALLEAHEHGFMRSLFARAVIARTGFEMTRGGCALAVLRASPRDQAARDVARRCATRLLREPVSSGPPTGHLVKAGLALADGRSEAAATELRESIEGFDRGDMLAYAAAARRRLGKLVSGDEGRALLAVGDAALLERGVIDLDAMTEMLAPGCGV